MQQELDEIISNMVLNGVTLDHINSEINYRDHSEEPQWNGILYEYSTDVLIRIWQYWHTDIDSSQNGKTPPPCAQTQLRLSVPAHEYQAVQMALGARGATVEEEMAKALHDKYRWLMTPRVRANIAEALHMRQAAQVSTWAFSVFSLTYGDSCSYYRSSRYTRPYDFAHEIARMASKHMDKPLSELSIWDALEEKELVDEEYYQTARQATDKPEVCCIVDIDMEDMLFSYTYPGSPTSKRLDLAEAVSIARDIYLGPFQEDRDMLFINRIADRAEHINLKQKRRLEPGISL